jgi:hypothetical protein
MTAWGTFSRSNYNAMTVTLRKRFEDSLTFDFNYTWSKSMDQASSPQDSGIYGGPLILNAVRPDDIYAESDFDVRHIVNSNWLWRMPFGREKEWLNDLPGYANAVLGDWSLNGIFRWNTGLPVWSPVEVSRWATNYNVQSAGTRIRDPQVQPHKSGDHPNFWANPLYAYNSFRNAKAGETGDRNVFRVPSFFSIDLGIHKGFRIPSAEGHRLTFACEVFNLTNTQILGWPSNNALGVDPQIAEEPYPGFGNINRIQGIPRVMQFSLRYDF